MVPEVFDDQPTHGRRSNRHRGGACIIRPAGGRPSGAGAGPGGAERAPRRGARPPRGDGTDGVGRAARAARLRKLDETRAEIRGAQATSERLDKELADTEESLRDPEVAKFRDEVAARIKQLRQAKAAAVTQLQRLQLEETTLLNDIAADQARWVEVNRVLEDLDRSLTRR
jgi:hypothetical protein